MSNFDPAVSRGFVTPYEEVFATLRRGEASARDGTRVAYQVVGSGTETVVLANGLGGRLYSWLALMAPLAERFRFVSWDYRGLFESAGAQRPGELAVPEHAADLGAILDAEGVDTAHLIGWSMGVQVSLEFALRHPERVRSLVLINGTFGQVFDTAFQPFTPLPLPREALHGSMDLLINHPTLLRALQVGTRTPTEALFWLRKRVAGWRQSTLTLGLRQYMRDVTTTDTAAYLRLFQELDAHTVRHELRDVQAPTTVISGAFDYLTPAYQSEIMADEIPGAVYAPIRLGTHFVLIERPKKVLAAVESHFGRLEAGAVT